MANEIRLYSDSQGGQLDTQVDTTAGGSFTLSSPAFANLPVVDTSHHLMIKLDPDGDRGPPESFKITAHTSGATTVTATGAQDGTVGRVHYVDEWWIHGVVQSDLGLGNHGCLVWLNAAQTIAASGTLVVPFDSSENDSDSYHSNTTNNSRITIPVGLGGMYLVSAQIWFGTNASAGSAAGFHVRKNGTTNVRTSVVQFSSVSNLSCPMPAFRYFLADGDYLELNAYNNSSANTESIINGENFTWFSVTKVA